MFICVCRCLFDLLLYLCMCLCVSVLMFLFMCLVCVALSVFLCGCGSCCFFDYVFCGCACLLICFIEALMFVSVHMRIFASEFLILCVVASLYLLIFVMCVFAYLVC